MSEQKIRYTSEQKPSTSSHYCVTYILPQIGGIVMKVLIALKQKTMPQFDNDFPFKPQSSQHKEIQKEGECDYPIHLETAMWDSVDGQAKEAVNNI